MLDNDGHCSVWTASPDLEDVAVGEGNSPDDGILTEGLHVVLSRALWPLFRGVIRRQHARISRTEAGVTRADFGQRVPEHSGRRWQSGTGHDVISELRAPCTGHISVRHKRVDVSRSLVSSLQSTRCITSQFGSSSRSQFALPASQAARVPRATPACDACHC